MNLKSKIVLIAGLVEENRGGKQKSGVNVYANRQSIGKLVYSLKEITMDCPVCKNVQLLMSDRQGIEIDYCPNCRGVWLDRGELDKLIDRSTGTQTPQGYAPPQSPYPQQQHQPGYGHAQPSPEYPQRHQRKKREGFLGELFDFD